MCKFSQQAKPNEIQFYLLAVLLWHLGAALLGHLAALLAGNLLAALLGNVHALGLRNLFALLVRHVHRIVLTGLDWHLLAILRRGSVAWIRLVAGQALLVVVRCAFLLQLAPVRRGANLLVLGLALLLFMSVALVLVRRLAHLVVGGLAVVFVVGVADALVLRLTLLLGD